MVKKEKAQMQQVAISKKPPAVGARKGRRGPIELELDGRVGHAIRSARVARGLSQEDLGERVGITFQQIQKYEKGTNRVASSRLVTFARVLGTTPHALLGWADEGTGSLDIVDSGSERGIMELMRLATQLDSADVSILRDIARHLATR